MPLWRSLACDAACNCGAPLVPAWQRAAAAIAANPLKSDRAIAEELGVSDMTVGRARKSTATSVAVDDRPTIDKPPRGELWDDQDDKQRDSPARAATSEKRAPDWPSYFGGRALAVRLV
jgi:hypothetical protein